eukprot:CAMPEP_0198315890 /NCGR_PEP_ID=MMETSP1450-20131203/5980_1 /TAXON_ID=753684 ORGANISM="Madagascaria erythrocladiodes, Strain CCMP3234" /NCGR_SAMPLE_ID=MMETSP1450 /ASSEMBLY_ACC=CAM_ASM_001115 /LENGTH=289 /DNA_ID=CAMNT_0044019017 /DNA_START=43 /DNA_END=912 /DNA_ORIENTATION=+
MAVWRQVAVAAAAVAVVAAPAARAVSGILTGTFRATLYREDLFENAFCLNTGAPHVSMSLSSVDAKPQCTLGKVGVEQLADSTTLGLRFGDIKDVQTASAHLGTIAELFEHYKLSRANVSDAQFYASLRVNADQESKFDFISNAGTGARTGIEKGMVDGLYDRAQRPLIDVTPGHLYLLRVTQPGKPVEDDVLANNNILVKLLVLERTDGHITVRWNVMQSREFVYPQNPYEEPIGSSAFVLALLTFIMMILFMLCTCCFCILKKRKGKRYAKMGGGVSGFGEHDHDSE